LIIRDGSHAQEAQRSSICGGDISFRERAAGDVECDDDANAMG
jgi:hypothetical protein